MSRAVLAVAALAAVYLLALASLDPLDALFGVALGAGALALVRRLGAAEFTPPPLLSRALGVPALVWATLRDITVGTWDVALVVLKLRPLVSPGIVAIPIGERSRLGVAATGLLTTLAPGEFLVTVDWEHGVMFVHVIDASDPDEVRERYRHFYERYQRRVFP